jgi:KUP system potassium uptake protein
MKMEISHATKAALSVVEIAKFTALTSSILFRLQSLITPFDSSWHTEKLADKFSLRFANPVHVPIDANFYNLNRLQQSPLMESKKLYQEIIGSLVYVSIISRPDVSFATSCLSQYLQSPSEFHLKAAKQVIVYLFKTRTKKLTYSKSNDFKSSQILAYTDSDWASDPKDRKSRTGYLIFYKGCLIAWNSRKQSLVSLSSAEAEYVAESHTGRKIKWQVNLLQELLITIQLPAIFTKAQ